VVSPIIDLAPCPCFDFASDFSSTDVIKMAGLSQQKRPTKLCKRLRVALFLLKVSAGSSELHITVGRTRPVESRSVKLLENDE
jgi:hypothetical protein